MPAFRLPARLGLWIALALIVAAAVPPPVRASVAPPTGPPVGVSPQREPDRFFPETGYGVENDAIWAYFQSRGGLSSFGYPASAPFRLLGSTVQIFQRQVLQVGSDGSVHPLNLLDPDLMPVTSVNFATFPRHEERVATAAPAPAAPNYAGAVQTSLAENVPDEWEGLPVRFRRTYLAAGSGPDPLLGALEVWGFATSRPQRDPNNRSFVYQRFQRGILHYDAATDRTGGILLADAFKSVLTWRDTPPDLADQMQSSRFARQYCPGQSRSLCRPADLPDSDLSGAFESRPRYRTITQADDGRTIELRPGEQFLLSLGNATDWRVTIDDPTVVSPVREAAIPLTATGVYEARRPGRTGLTAIGEPPCRNATPPCLSAAPSRRFRIELIVRSPAVP